MVVEHYPTDKRFEELLAASRTRQSAGFVFVQYSSLEGARQIINDCIHFYDYEGI